MNMKNLPKGVRENTHKDCNVNSIQTLKNKNYEKDLLINCVLYHIFDDAGTMPCDGNEHRCIM